MISIRRFFLNNLGLKGISLLLAFLLWQQAASRQTVVQKSVTLPVTFVNIPPDTAVLSDDSEKRVDVVLQSDRGTIDERELALQVDLKSYSPGPEQIVILADRNVNRPSGVDVISISPSRIRLRLEPTTRKFVEVEPHIVGDPAEGYEITGYRVTPASILISGPQSFIEEVSTARTGPVDVGGRSETFFETTFIDLAVRQIRIEEPSPVTVAVTIEEKRRGLRLRGVKVQVTPAGVGARLLDENVDVQGSVPLSFPGRVSKGSFQAVIDLTGLPPREEVYELTPEIVIPEEYAEVFRLESFQPAQIRVRRLK